MIGFAVPLNSLQQRTDLERLRQIPLLQDRANMWTRRP